MRKLLILLVVVVVSVGLLISSCGESTTPAPAPTTPSSTTPSTTTPSTTTPSTSQPSTPAQPTAPAAPDNQIFRLKYSTHGAPTQTNQIALDKWRRTLEERSDGRIKITEYFSASLLPYEDTYRGCQVGLADMISYVIGQNEGVHYLNDFVRLPGLGYSSTIVANDIYYELSDMFPEIKAEFKDLVVVNHFMMPAIQVHMTKKDVKVPQDMAGTKVIGNATYSEGLAKVDSAIIITGYPDWYMSLERGLTEGLLTHYPAAEGSGCKELFKSHTHIGGSGLGLGMHFILMNEEVFNSMPADLQALIMDPQLNRPLDNEIMQMDIDATERIMNEQKGWGQTFYECTPAEIAQWQELFSYAFDDYIEKCEQRGLPGKELLEESNRLVEEYRNK